MKEIKLIKRDGNRAVGIFYIDGQYLSMTYAESKTFKTERGASRWLAMRGYN